MLCIFPYSYTFLLRKETMAAAAPLNFVLFGGTFDPIHEGHVGLVRGLLQRADIDRIFLVPAAQNPFKGAEAHLPAQLRLELASRAVAGICGAAVLDLELMRGGPSYTMETVAALASQYPDAHLKLAMGWDVYESFRDWRSAAELLELASLLVVLRQGSATPGSGKSRQWLAGLPPRWRDRLRMGANGVARQPQGRTVVEFVNLRLPRMSSSQVRAKRDLSMVPAEARKLLEQYWARERARGA